MNLAGWAETWRSGAASPWCPAAMCAAFLWRAYVDAAASHPVGALLAVSGVVYTAIVTAALYQHPTQVTPPKNAHRRR